MTVSPKTLSKTSLYRESNLTKSNYQKVFNKKNSDGTYGININDMSGRIETGADANCYFENQIIIGDINNDFEINLVDRHSLQSSISETTNHNLETLKAITILDNKKYLINILGDEIINNVHSISFKLTAINDKST